MTNLVKIAAWVTEEEAQRIREAAAADKRSVSSFVKTVLLDRVSPTTVEAAA